MNPRTGFIKGVRVVTWKPGWKQLREVALPAGSRKANPILIPSVNDVNERGTMVGTIYGLTANDYGSLRRIDPVVWRCQFGS